MEKELYQAENDPLKEVPEELLTRLCYLSIVSGLPLELLVHRAIREYVETIEDYPILTRKDDVQRNP